MTKTGGFSGWRGWDRVVSFNWIAIDDDAVNEAFDQASFLFKQSLLQAAP